MILRVARVVRELPLGHVVRELTFSCKKVVKELPRGRVVKELPRRCVVRELPLPEIIYIILPSPAGAILTKKFSICIYIPQTAFTLGGSYLLCIQLTLSIRIAGCQHLSQGT